MSVCVFASVAFLKGTSEAHEDDHMQCEQVGQEEISRACTACQQLGEVEAPPSEPLSARHHPTFHLEAQTPNNQEKCSSKRNS